MQPAEIPFGLLVDGPGTVQSGARDAALQSS